MKIHPDAHEGRVSFGEVSVPYYDTGMDSDGRPVVLLVHGTGGSTKTHFRTLFPMLVPKYRVIGLDLQPASDALTLDDLSSQVINVLEERCSTAPVNLVGYSLGALVAASVTAQRPQSVATLSLIAGWVKADAHQRLRNSIWSHLYEKDHEALKKFATLTAFGQPYISARSDDEIQALIQDRTFPEGIAAQMKLNKEADISPLLGDIDAPTLVLGGTYDQMVPTSQTRLLYGGITNARYAQIDTGHAVPTERPAQVFQLINEFISAPTTPVAERPMSTSAV